MKNKNLFSEFALVEKIKRRFENRAKSVLLGIGDDAAHLKTQSQGLFATVDMLMEGVHFDLNYFDPAEVGHKAVAVNLSDLAAMGGEPKFVLVSLGVRSDLNPSFLDELFTGMERQLRLFDVALVGGNLTRSPHSLVVDITALGEPTGKVLTRAGAQVGHRVAVTGTLGGAAAGFWALQREGRAAKTTQPEITSRQLCPTPRVAEGKALSHWGASAAMDVSDGLASELGHLGQASGVGFLIEESALPVLEATRRFAAEIKADWRKWVLNGGEDYELLFTYDPARGKPPIACTDLGEVVPAEKGIKLARVNGQEEAVVPQGWDHFIS